MSAPGKGSRITSRIAPAMTQKLRMAAGLTGVSLNQIMVQASLEKAEKIIDQEAAIHFSRKDAAMLISLLDNPPEANAALMRAFKRFAHREVENGNQP
jgi:uncharacterized protein (DUF1778 family)